MQKTITFKRHDQCSLAVPYQLWRAALRLALDNNWKPEGTLPPQPYPYQAPWDGAYEWAYGQNVRTADAQQLGQCLRHALEEYGTLIDVQAREEITVVADFCKLGAFEIVAEVQQHMPENKLQPASESVPRENRFEPDPPDDPVPGFTVCKDELYLLMKYWYRKALDIQFDNFLLGECHRCRLRDSADCRFSAIAEVVGPELQKRAIAEVEKDFRDKYPYLWRAFLMDIPVRRGSDGVLLPEEHQLPLWIVENQAEQRRGV